jgi:integrase
MDAIKVDEPPTQPLTDAEYTAVLAASTGRTRAIIQLMRWSGLAVRDASCLLSSELIFTDANYQVITARQKTGIDVSVPIPQDVAAEILAAADKGKPRLFWNSNGKAENFSRDRGREISAAFKKAKVATEGHMISHRLRDTFACHCLSNGVPMEEVSKLLGHTSIITTERHYSAWAVSRQARVNELVIGTWK